jgi:SAM-dependent methyltransferase
MGPAPRTSADRVSRVSPRERFRALDEYRVEREWKRYEGTAQRELFRSLRERFLRRHQVPTGWTLEVGPGPGRFSAWVGGPGARRVQIDLSREMLRAAARTWGDDREPKGRPERIEADGVHPPFRPRNFSEVVVLGNAVGFAGEAAEPMVDGLLELVRPGGIVIFETSPGPGTRSRYLRRLPVGAVRRILPSPLRLLSRRIVEEGFDGLPETRAREHGFRRMGPPQMLGRLTRAGFTVRESTAVAAALGSEPERLEALQRDAAAWPRLVEIEEALGHDPDLQRQAAAWLVAAQRM